MKYKLAFLAASTAASVYGYNTYIAVPKVTDNEIKGLASFAPKFTEDGVRLIVRLADENSNDMKKIWNRIVPVLEKQYLSVDNLKNTIKAYVDTLELDYNPLKFDQNMKKDLESEYLKLFLEGKCKELALIVVKHEKKIAIQHIVSQVNRQIEDELRVADSISLDLNKESMKKKIEAMFKAKGVQISIKSTAVPNGVKVQKTSWFDKFYNPAPITLQSVRDFVTGVSNNASLQSAFTYVTSTTAQASNYVASPQFSQEFEQAKVDLKNKPTAQKAAMAAVAMPAAYLFANSSRSTKTLLTMFAAAAAVKKLADRDPNANTQQISVDTKHQTVTPTPATSVVSNPDKRVRNALGY